MSDVQNVTDPYAIVLADLYAQRDRIAVAISALEGLRGGSAAPVASASAADTPKQGMGAGAFLGMSIVDAAKKLLAHERRQMNNAELVEGLKRGGLALNSADPLNTVGSVLNRRFIQVGDVVRVARGTWGLKEWYPNRSFKSSVRAADAEASRPTDQDLEDLGLGDTVNAPDPEAERAARAQSIEDVLG